MALPKISDVPYYDVIIPSTGHKTRFRPYLVREEKILLIALETSDQDQITKATMDMLSACIENGIDTSTLTLFDAEYLFLKIRSKSVGEKIELTYPCMECEEENDFVVNLDDVKVSSQDEAARTIVINDDVSVKMRYMSYVEINNNPKLVEPGSIAEFIFESVVGSLYSVDTEEESMLVKDEPIEDVIHFLESLTTEQFAKLRDFVEDAPIVKADLSFECKKCKATNEFTLRGLDDFFG
jgi:ribosomal protein L44E